MPGYRLYILNPETDHITGAEEVFAADDVAAVHATRQRHYCVPVELWQGARKIKRIGAMPEGRAPWSAEHARA